MSKEKIRNAVIYVTLFWFELQIKTQGKYHLPFLLASQPSVRCCKIVVIENFALANSWVFCRRIGSLIGMLLPRTDVNHFSKASFNFLYVPFFTLCCFSDEFWKASKIFSLFLFQVARVLPGILNWLATFLLGLSFSSSFNALYFTFKVTSWCFLFVAIFDASATNNRIQTNLKISKHSNIMAFELKHLNLLQ